MGRVHVETRTLAQIIGLIIGHMVPARRGVGKNQRDPLFGRPDLSAGLGHRVLMGAGQARQIPQHGHRRMRGLFGQEQAKGHVTSQHVGRVGIDPLGPAKAFVFRNCGDHFCPLFLSQNLRAVGRDMA